LILILGMLLFGILASAVSSAISKSYMTLERDRMVTYVALIAWCSMLFGFFIASVHFGRFSWLAPL